MLFVVARGELHENLREHCEHGPIVSYSRYDGLSPEDNVFL